MFPVKNPDDLKNLALGMKWQWFEKLVGWVFQQNDFETEVNRVEVFEKGRRQFDLIAKRFDDIFLVECKKWSGDRYRTGPLKRAASKHLEKCGMFEERYKKKAIPIIVTLVDEDVISHEGIPVVPIEKLNSFINHFQEWM